MNTPIEEIREAAKQLRERAEKATPGPWASAPKCWAGPNAVLSMVYAPHAVAVCGDEHPGDYPASADAAYIACMHPGVALAVADWMGFEASHAARYGVRVHPTLLAVARAVRQGGGR